MSSGGSPAGQVDVAPRRSSGARHRLSELASDPVVVAVSALTIVTFALRFSQIHQSLFGDEGFTYQDIVGRTLPQVVRNVHTGAENSPPLFFIFAWLTAKIGNPLVWIRLPSIVFEAATVSVLYLIGCRTIGRIPGLIAGLIVALSPFSLYYGVEARP